MWQLEIERMIKNWCEWSVKKIVIVIKISDLSNLVKLGSGSRKKSSQVDMLTLSFFVWTVLRSIIYEREIHVESRRESQIRDSLDRDKERRDSRRDSKENSIVLAHCDRRRPRTRRHSRRYYVERHRRWVVEFRRKFNSQIFPNISNFSPRGFNLLFTFSLWLWIISTIIHYIYDYD